MADEDDYYRVETHACKFCKRCFESSWVRAPWDREDTILLIDLASGLDAMFAAKQGCSFFQSVLYPSFLESESVQIQFHVNRQNRSSPEAPRFRLECYSHFGSPDSEDDLPLFPPNQHDRWVELLGTEAVENLGTSSWFAYAQPDHTQDDPWLDTVESPPNLDPSSTKSAALIGAWSNTCAQQEEVVPSLERGLPHRLLKIEPNSNIVRLVRNKEAYNYALLSYCWGGAQNTRTTTSNLAKHEQGIHSDSLPQTIRDAIHVTKLLQLEYLWVDALCIVQDDSEDLTKEIANQANMYKGGTVTILAGDAASVDRGFLHRRTKPQSILRIRLPNGRERRLLLQDRPWDHVNDVNSDYVNNRAWIFQEILLSPNILYFSPSQMVLFNRQAVYLDGGHLEHSFPYREKVIHLFSDANCSSGVDLVRLEELQNAWQILVMHYSTRALTYPADRLPAFAGVAEAMGVEISAAHGDQELAQYCAGLWKIFMPLSLLWNPEERLPRPPYRAPSWSWASVEGRIWFATGIHKELASFPPNQYTPVVTGVHTQLMSDNARFGQVTDGEVHIRGFVKDIPHYVINGVVDGKSGYLEVDHPHDLSRNFLLDAIEPNMAYPCTPESGYVLCVLCIIRVMEDLELDQPEKVPSQQQMRWSIAPRMHGLIFCKRSNQENYFRIGICHFWEVRPEDARWLDSFEVRDVTIV